METKTIEQLRLEYLDEVANFYNNENRSVNKARESCVYDDGLGHTCAIGLKLSPELRKKFDELGTMGAVNNIFDRLPMELQIYGKDFLADLQSLHDRSVHWNHHGLTATGKIFYDSIKKLYCVKAI